MAKMHAVQKLLALAGKFVVEKEGSWDHAAWEEFLQKAAKLGVEPHGDSERKLGEVIEGTKYFYHCLSANATKKKGASKRPGKTKANPGKESGKKNRKKA